MLRLKGSLIMGRSDLHWSPRPRAIARRKASCIAVLLAYGFLLWTPRLGLALGLGELERRSQLNEPFYGVIDLINAGADELDSMTVKLADSERFRKAGLERPAFLSQLRFEVVETDTGPDYIKVTSGEPVREPFLGFLLEVSWSKGRLFREFSVLFDPPGYKPQRVPTSPVVGPGAARVPRAARARQAAAPPPGRSGPERDRGAGAGLDSDRYGPTKSGDTLWAIASRLPRDRGTSVQQLIVALLRANPHAFFQDNVNALKRGVVLELPDRQTISRVQRQDALQVMSQHNGLWEEYRQRIAAATAPRPAGAVSSAGSGAPEAPTRPVVPDDARLELASAESGSPSARTPGATSAPGGPETGNRALTMAEETVASQSSEIQELNAKLEESDKIIKLLRRQIELKDEELSTLQAKVAGPSAAQEPGQTAAALPEATAVPGGAAPDQSPVESREAQAPAGEAGVAPEAQPGVTAPSEGTPPAEGAEPPPVEGSSKGETDASESPTPAGDVGIDSEGTVAPPMAPDPDIVAAPGGAAAPGGSDVSLGGSWALIGGAAAILLLVAGWYLMRHRRAAVSGPEAFSDVEAFETQALSEPTTPTDRPMPLERSESVSAGAETPQAIGTEAEDPLADVDVYLAYERFAEAERLVKQAVASAPDEHKYKLRLLEVYYASGNKAAYEDYARILRDAVGGSGPLWESALAMWHAISPERPLFGEGGAAESEAVSAREFIDLGTGEAMDARMAGTSPAPEESADAYASGPGGDTRVDSGAGDLDLHLEPAAAAVTPMQTARFAVAAPHAVPALDVSAEGMGVSAEPFDGALRDVIDLTTGERAGSAGDEEIEGTVLDVRKAAAQASEVLDVSVPRGEESFPPSSPSPAATGTFLDLSGSPAVKSADAMGLASAIDLDLTLGEQSLAPLPGMSLDRTLASAQEGAREAIEFGSREPPSGPATVAAFNAVSGDQPAMDEPSIARALPEMRLDEGAATVEFDLSDLDFEIVEPAVPTDLKPASASAFGGLGLVERDAPVVADSGTAQSSPLLDEGLELEFPAEAEADISEMFQEAAKSFEASVEMPVEDDGIAADTDIKLNLAKAYIELGDVEGARVILGEVTEVGSADQREEAEGLLRQLG